MSVMLLMTALEVVVATLGGRVVVALVLRLIDAPPGTASRAGPWIGVFERLLVFQLASAGQWGAIGWVLTAKSIARFKEMEDRRFAEQYLIGTLASFAWSLGVVGVSSAVMTTPEFKPGQVAEHVSAREGYDRWAEIYDAEDNPLIALEEPRVAEHLGEVRGLDVLDLGCGTGRHTLRLARAGARVTAVDFAEGMVAKAAGKAGWERVRFVLHDLARPLPLQDASFDRVCSFLVLDHIVDVDAFFRECRRVCRSDGSLLVTVMHPAMMLRGILAHFRDPATGRDVCPESAANQVSTYVMAAIRAGWTIEHLSEHAVGEDLAAESPRAAKYLGWPMLLILRARFAPPPRTG